VPGNTIYAHDLSLLQIFEQSRFRSEVGAAISTTPNASCILERWGIDPELAGGTELLMVSKFMLISYLQRL
jgi:hypothetical protein